MEISVTLWFFGSDQYTADYCTVSGVDTKDALKNARILWDAFSAKGFRMLSARP